MGQMSAANQAAVQKWLDKELEEARRNSRVMDGVTYQALLTIQSASTITTA